LANAKWGGGVSRVGDPKDTLRAFGEKKETPTDRKREDNEPTRRTTVNKTRSDTWETTHFWQEIRAP